jgi:hypothetical protein
MIGTMAKILAYKNAPRTTFAVLHPRTSAQLAHTKYDLKHGYAPRLTAVGAALLAMPVGFLIGKLVTDRRTDRILERTDLLDTEI